MRYDYKKIGARIKEERIKAGFKNQSDFAERLCLSVDSRQTIGKWENGHGLPDIDTLREMCDIFQCELGYLLCEYDCKNREVADIHEATGLSEKAIEQLKIYKECIEGNSALNQLIEHADFGELLSLIENHIYNYNRNCINIRPEEVETLSYRFNCDPSEIAEYVEAASQTVITSKFMKIVNDMK